MPESPDIRGYIANYAGQGCMWPVMLFLTSTYLHYANKAAGCSAAGETCAVDEGPSNNDPCGKVWGFRPAALISFLMTVSSLMVAAFMPVVGSIVDHSAHRRAIGRGGLFVAWACCAAQVAVSKGTWPVLFLVQLIFSVGYVTNGTCVLAYMAELTTDLKDEIVAINTRAWVCQMTSMLSYMVFVAGLSIVLPLGVVDQGRLAAATAALVGGPVILRSWQQLTDRPAAKTLPEGTSVWTRGFEHIKGCTSLLYAEYPQLLKFYLVVALSEAGSNSIVGLSLIYYKEQLCMSNKLAISVTIVSVVSTIPGVLLSKLVAAGGRAKQAYVGCLVAMSLAVLSLPFLLFRPEQAIGAFAFAIFLGACMGFIQPTMRSLLAILIPGGFEGQMGGIFMFCCTLLVWLPSLVFTTAYEVSGSMRLGVGLVSIFYAAAGGILCFGVDVSRGAADAARTIADRRGAAFEGVSLACEKTSTAVTQECGSV